MLGILLIASLILPPYPFPPFPSVVSDSAVDIASPTIPRINVTEVHLTFDTPQNATYIDMQWGSLNKTLQLYFFLPFQITSARLLQGQGNVTQPSILSSPKSWYVNATVAKYDSGLTLWLVTPNFLNHGIWKDTVTLFFSGGPATPSMYLGPPYPNSILLSSQRVDVTIGYPKEQFHDSDTFPSPSYSYPSRDEKLDTWTFIRSSPQFFFSVELSLITHTWTWKAPFRLPIEAQGIVLSLAFVLFAYGVSSMVAKRQRSKERGWDPAL
jgi:hypothetical protein